MLHNLLHLKLLSLNNIILLFHRHLRPAMMQQLLRRLVFDVPMLTEYCKIPITVRHWTCFCVPICLFGYKIIIEGLQEASCTLQPFHFPHFMCV